MNIKPIRIKKMNLLQRIKHKKLIKKLSNLEQEIYSSMGVPSRYFN